MTRATTTENAFVTWSPLTSQRDVGEKSRCEIQQLSKKNRRRRRRTASIHPCACGGVEAGCGGQCDPALHHSWVVSGVTLLSERSKRDEYKKQRQSLDMNIINIHNTSRTFGHMSDSRVFFLPFL